MNYYRIETCGWLLWFHGFLFFIFCFFFCFVFVLLLFVLTKKKTWWKTKINKKIMAEKKCEQKKNGIDVIFSKQKKNGETLSFIKNNQISTIFFVEFKFMLYLSLVAKLLFLLSHVIYNFRS